MRACVCQCILLYECECNKVSETYREKDKEKYDKREREKVRERYGKIKDGKNDREGERECKK